MKNYVPDFQHCSLGVVSEAIAKNHMKEGLLDHNNVESFKPCFNPAQAFPLIELAGISIIRCEDEYMADDEGYALFKIDAEGEETSVTRPLWCAVIGYNQLHDEMYTIDEDKVFYGDTMLIAAMRCYAHHFCRSQS